MPEAIPPDPRTFIVSVFDRAAPTYDDVGVDFFGPIARPLIEDAALQPGDRVLDVGCGRGAVLFPAADAVGPTGHVTGIDLAPAMVEHTAQDIATRGIANADVKVMDAQEPSLEPSSYDAVLSSLALFFLPQPVAALRAYREALRTGGRIAFTTFGGDDERWTWLDDMRATFLPDRQIRPPGQDTFGSDEAIAALLTEAGYTQVTSCIRVLEVRFADVDQWLRWTWSQGMRVFWEQLGPEHTDEAVAYAAERIAAFTEPDGTIPLTQPVRYTVAHG